MVLTDFKVLCLSKSMNREKLPVNTDFIPKVYSALKRVAKDTVPLRLVVNDGTGQQIMRKADEFMLIRFPFPPRVEDDIIDIDDALLDAVALFTMAGIELSRSQQYMGLYYAEIELNNERLVETFLQDASNDSPHSSAAQVFA